MTKNWWLISLAGALCFASGCTSKTVSKPGSAAVDATVASGPAPTDANQTQPLTSKDFFPNPLVSASTPIQPVPVPNLIPPTASVDRVPQVDTGRADPFASLNLAPTVVKVKTPAPAPAPSTSVVTVAPQPQTLPLPPLLPAAASPAPLPSVNIPTRITPPPSLAESIEISGVVQVAGRTNVIIKSPDEQTSRYITVGERLGNGKVLIKRVEMGLEPIVILEQDGREIVRSVGSSSALIGAM